MGTMKRSILAFALFVLMAGMGSVVFAQDSDDDSTDIQVLTVYIQKVYPHRLGYRLIYFKSDLYPGEAFLPSRWFTQAAGKGEIIESEAGNVPYMHIYWHDGEFNHVRLFVHADRSHRSWGALPSDVDYRNQFAIETLELEF